MMRQIPGSGLPSWWWENRQSNSKTAVPAITDEVIE
jgi:hypothetical protein